ncbi:tetratricopeptide repeat protein [Aciduricibacillus chroicocephali]|uniref:Tetratricopeptide repeat protein n=1 Tax=Aciduricibacillus chroicocephali TaxID=3054939 RepID=A0ABY9KT42_9BACI|nr:tetratricopeptide repeat protein [Bacillaceae bacterium 44XB]
MTGKSDNLILFPKWKKRLENESLAALKEKRYSEALEKLDLLIYYNEASSEIHVGKLICLMELGEFGEAQSEVESLLESEDDGFYDYMHIYLTLLFQTDQHDLLVETVDEVLERPDLPSSMKEQYQQLYAISENMRSDLSDRKWKEDMSSLIEAVQAEDHRRQWGLIEEMRKTRIEPDHFIQEMLLDDTVHPVTKTAILLWLKDRNHEGPIGLKKFGHYLEVVPNDLPTLGQFELGLRVRNLLKETEQQDPTRYGLMMEALERYLYVLYPFNEPERNPECIVHALRFASGNDIVEEGSSNCSQYIEELNTCQALYLTIIGT